MPHLCGMDVLLAFQIRIEHLLPEPGDAFTLHFRAKSIRGICSTKVSLQQLNEILLTQRQASLPIVERITELLFDEVEFPGIDFRLDFGEAFELMGVSLLLMENPEKYELQTFLDSKDNQFKYLGFRVERAS